MLRNMRGAVRIAGMLFRTGSKRAEIYMAILLQGLFLYSRALPIRQMALSSGHRVTPFFFPFLCTNPYLRFFFLTGCIVLFARLPVWNASQGFVMIRTGRRLFFVGQVLYTIMVSALYVLVEWFLSVMVLLPYISPDGRWGVIWKSLAQTENAMYYDMTMRIPYEFIAQFSPAEAVLRAALMAFLTASLTGLVICACNYLLHRRSGFVIAAAAAAFTVKIRSFPAWFVWISPMSWCDLTLVRTEAVSEAPTFGEAVWILLACITLLAVLLISCSGRRDLME